MVCFGRVPPRVVSYFGSIATSGSRFLGSGLSVPGGTRVISSTTLSLNGVGTPTPAALLGDVAVQVLKPEGGLQLVDQERAAGRDSFSRVCGVRRARSDGACRARDEYRGQDNER